MKKLSQDLSYKISLRNMLGIKYADDWIHRLKIENVTFLAKIKSKVLEEGSVERGFELKKDAMLEKVVLMIVTWYIVGLSAGTEGEAENFLAKSVHLAVVFLPAESPLVNHLINIYAAKFLQKKEEIMSPPKVTLKGSSLMAGNIKSLL